MLVSEVGPKRFVRIDRQPEQKGIVLAAETYDSKAKQVDDQVNTKRNATLESQLGG